MKVLDVSSLHDGIKGMSRQLSELKKQLNHVESGIRTFVSSEDSFRGKGASAIRRFYEYAHLPFLQFFQSFLANFQSKLQQLQLVLDTVESNSRGFIDESFLTSELEDGLNQLNRMVTDLTGETNAQLSRISDIVYLPRLQDHQFHEGIQHAKQSANQTLNKLHQFDHQQTQSFTALIADLSLINSYIEEMSQQFASGKIKLTSFSPVMLQDLEAYGKLQTKLYNQTVMQRWNSEHFPELGVFYPIGHATSYDQWVNPSCARPEPKKKTAGEAFWDFTNGFGAGIISAASDTWDGIKRLATEPDQVLKETIEFLDTVVSDPAILLEIGHELYNSFNESVINGDATSRGEWLGYATTIIGTSVVGDKGLSKVGGIAGRLGTKVETDLNIKLKDQQEKVMSSVNGSSAVGLERVRELMGGMFPNSQWGMALAGVPHNVMDSRILRDRIELENQFQLSKVEQIAGKVNYGNHFQRVNRRKVLKPNVEYVTKEGYKYKTNDIGAIEEVRGVLKAGEGIRNLYAQRLVGGRDRLADDDGGHLIASQFLGSGELDNLVPMNSQINRSGGKWYKLEGEWANALKLGKEVNVRIEAFYDQNSMRPSSFEIEYKIEGERTRIIEILNQSGG
ncbi:T7SS effector LXG polymorphic toxin [Sutcliffiella horikoshii]|uniref:T7SS effector LXG polymorphic toxin n=1 Tax=Sutcliffiella horikoshii TaxID=79883 RepID=UPI00384D14B4